MRSIFYSLMRCLLGISKSSLFFLCLGAINYNDAPYEVNYKILINRLMHIIQQERTVLTLNP